MAYRLSFAVLLFVPSIAAAQPNVEATHDALRALRDQGLAAVSGGDFDALAEHVHPNVVLTVENGTVVRSKDGLRDFYQRTLAGPNAALEGFTVSDFEVDELSILYGDDTAIAFGSANLEYRPRGGEPLREKARWSATMVRENERWLIASFHTSVDFTTSQLMDRAISMTMKYAGGIGAVVGLGLGIAGGFWFGRRRRPQAKAHAS
jgi:ketosteroid isomerase-like protein